MSDESPVLTPNSAVSLREITAESFRDIATLSVADSQKQFVAPNVYSIAQAYFSKNAWFRAIYADETPVGFLMLHDAPEEPNYFLWRFMIDQRYQKYGFGKKAIQLLIEHVKTRPNATALGVSYVPGEGSPEWFYRKLGFEPTGEVDEGEIVAKLVF